MRYNKHTTAAGLTADIFRGAYFKAASRLIKLSNEERAEVLPLVERASGKSDYDAFLRHVRIEESK